MPRTFAPPGVDGRYVFSSDVFRTARAILRRSTSLDSRQARLLRVLLGSVLVANSNVTINGKGRRYRKNWDGRRRTGNYLIESLDAAVATAAAELIKFAGLPKGSHALHCADARTALTKVSVADVAIFSPPYPNSFDYTDVYNLELWMLGHLRSPTHNSELRQQTFRSHVQTKWDMTSRIASSKRLSHVVRALTRKRAELWNRNIPEMIGFYFDDLCTIFNAAASSSGAPPLPPAYLMMPHVICEHGNTG